MLQSCDQVLGYGPTEVSELPVSVQGAGEEVEDGRPLVIDQPPGLEVGGDRFPDLVVPGPAEVPAVPFRGVVLDAEPVTKLAFEFLVLTATRSNNVRGAEWREVDMASGTWTIPAERMKGTEEAAREHRVPLSARAMELLAEARALSPDTDLVFPGPRSGRPLSDSTHSALLRELEIPAVPHGFRSSFKDCCIRADRHALGGGGGGVGSHAGQLD